MKKIYLTEMKEEKRNELIKKNSKLIEKLQNDLYEYYMFEQEEEGRYMLGDELHKYIDIKDDYNSFFLVLKDWYQFINNLDADYLAKEEAMDLYKTIKEKQEKLENICDCYSDEFYDLNAEIEEDCKKLLSYCEEQLHTYEQYPDEDDAIRYNDEMEQLEGYYIEEREDGTSDNVIRLDVAFTETFI